MDFKNKLILAPLAGVTDSVFRRICRRMGADITWSQMISAEGLARGEDKSRQLARFTEEERPLGIQLFGSDPRILGCAVEKVARLKPDFIDLNFGCPAPKVIKRNRGASLLQDPRLIGALVSRAVESAGGIPVTAKIRSGWNRDRLNYLEIAEELFRAGISAITLHPRTREQRFSGRSDWEQIKQLRRISPVPVIGSGDVFQPHDAVEMFQSTGCDAVMIGRGAMGNPWIFSRTKALLRGLPDPGGPSLQERFAQALEHTRMIIEECGEEKGIIFMRKHYCWYTRGLPNATGLRRELVCCSSLEEVLRIFSRYLEKCQCIPIG